MAESLFNQVLIEEVPEYISIENMGAWFANNWRQIQVGALAELQSLFNNTSPSTCPTCHELFEATALGNVFVNATYPFRMLVNCTCVQCGEELQIEFLPVTIGRIGKDTPF